MRLRSTFVGTVLVLSSAGALAQQQQPDALDARNQMNAAMTKGDRTAYARYLSDDLTWVDRTGRLRNKATMLAELGADAAGSTSAPAPPDLHSFGTSALLVGAARNADGIDVRYVQAWVKNRNQWQLVAHQAVPANPDQPGAPATSPSSQLPASAGLERDAVQKNFDQVNEASAKGDGKIFADAVTDRFVTLNVNGLRTRQERVDAISSAGPSAAVPPAPIESSLRVHGTLAVTTSRFAGNAQRGGTQRSSTWQTIVTVKDGGRWRRAAIVTTSITGAARPPAH